MKREPYTYAILRYRHDPVAGEQVNVGVVLYAPKSNFIGAQFRKAYSRVAKVFPDVNGAVLKHDLVRIEKAFNKLSTNEDPDLFSDSYDVMNFAHRVVGVDDSALVWSISGSGVTSDAEKTLNALHSRFISQYDQEVLHRRDDADVWKPFRDKLSELRIAEIFEPKIIQSPINEVEFDHAWKNGVWHCVQPISFDLVTAAGIQEKAAKWVGNLQGLSKATENFCPYFLVGAPSDPTMTRAYQRAVEFLREAPLAPTVVLEAEMEKFADEFLDKVNHSRQPSSN